MNNPSVFHNCEWFCEWYICIQEIGNGDELHWRPDEYDVEVEIDGVRTVHVICALIIKWLHFCIKCSSSWTNYPLIGRILAFNIHTHTHTLHTPLAGRIAEKLLFIVDSNSYQWHRTAETVRLFYSIWYSILNEQASKHFGFKSFSSFKYTLCGMWMCNHNVELFIRTNDDAVVASKAIQSTNQLASQRIYVYISALCYS